MSQMTTPDRTQSWWRVLLAFVIACHAVWFTYEILANGRFSAASAGRFAIVAAVVGVHAIAAALLMQQTGSFALRWSACILVFLTAARLHIPPHLLQARLQRPTDAAVDVVRHLREVTASQEQHRLRTGHYAASLNSLLDWMPQSPQIITSIRANGDEGWAGRSAQGATDCAIWVRDSGLRNDPGQREGVPHSVDAPLGTRRPLNGTWLEHRADERRTGIVAALPGDTGNRRTTAVDGEIRASPAVAGTQVFIGTHGNGEFVSLSLDSGHVDWRIRVANWVHHEPVVTPGLVIVTFGNNEHLGEIIIHSQPPGGIAAYDRRTGIERWHHYSTASVMTSPVVGDSLVAVPTTDNEAVEWRISDGHEAWRTTLPSHSWMGNPLVTGDKLIFGIEFTRLCVLTLPSGSIDYCTAVKGKGRGAGHASVAVADDLVLLTYDEEISVLPAVRAGLWTFLTTRLLGTEGTAGQQFLVALELATGRERWRVPLGGSSGATVQGHIAGTPVIQNGVAYIPSPRNGHVTAVRANSGRVLRSTSIKAVRSSVLVTEGAVLSATTDTALVVLDAATGKERCRQTLSAASDRAGPTLAGKTALLALRNGVVLARPIDDMLHCPA